MTIRLTSYGAAGEVTGSCHYIECGKYRLLLDCGLFQGSWQEEARNTEPLPFDVSQLDAVVLSHAHIDHSGRLPLLVKAGYTGPIYTHRATRDLCRIMLRDAAYLNEKDVEWENRKRERKGLRLIEPLYTRDDAEAVMEHFRMLEYGVEQDILPGVRIRLRDAGHILGSAFVELWLKDDSHERKLVFSGDLGHHGSVILRDPEVVDMADIVMLESTYGDRLHRSWEQTFAEFGEVMRAASEARGNILIPAFAVGRTQALLHLFTRHYQEWGLDRWQVFLDSPMAIEATEVYLRHHELYNADAAPLWKRNSHLDVLDNLYFSRTSGESMRINDIRSGALVIAGSGMCTGGRIRHHLKHNVWRKECHIIMVGWQQRGTLGRALVDGARHIRLWGETVKVAATVHTIGGLSAHADQRGLIDWYSAIVGKPRLLLVHGEEEAQQALAQAVRSAAGVTSEIVRHGVPIEL